MRRAIRLRLTRQPSRWRAAWTRGAPYVPRDAAWTATIASASEQAASAAGPGRAPAARPPMPCTRSGRRRAPGTGSARWKVVLHALDEAVRCVTASARSPERGRPLLLPGSPAPPRGPQFQGRPARRNGMPPDGSHVQRASGGPWRGRWRRTGGGRAGAHRLAGGGRGRIGWQGLSGSCTPATCPHTGPTVWCRAIPAQPVGGDRWSRPPEATNCPSSGPKRQAMRPLAQPVGTTRGVGMHPRRRLTAAAQAPMLATCPERPLSASPARPASPSSP